MSQLVVTSIANGDGNIFNDNTGASWAAVKALSAGTAQASSDPVNVYSSVFSSRSLSRIFIPFDTSALPANAVISSATLSFNVTTVFSASSILHVALSTQANPSSLANGDFGNITGGSGAITSGGSVSVSGTGIKTITLNATALGWLVKAGKTKLALLEDHDVTNTDPSPNDYRFGVNMAENGAAGNRPTLTINYTTSKGGGAFLQNFV